MRAKRQRVHATVDLMLREPKIEAEAKILENLRDKARRGMIDRSRDHLLQTPPALYIRYRRGGLPLLSQKNRKLPQWRSLTQWMRTQLAGICLSVLPHRQFRVRLHDELRRELEAQGADLRVYLRDRITRMLKERFDPVPWYLFVLEDLDKRGAQEVRPHAHGMIQLPDIDLSAFRDGRTRARFARIIRKYDLETAKEIAGREALRDALRQATGHLDRPRMVGGVDQSSNVWTRRSYSILYDKEAISYAFKNVDSDTSTLPVNRLAVSAGLRTEAQRFWELVRNGEDAVSQWS